MNKELKNPLEDLKKEIDILNYKFRFLVTHKEDKKKDEWIRVRPDFLDVPQGWRDLWKELEEENKEEAEKLLCTEICADPDLIRVVDGHGADMQRETRIERARGRNRRAICPLKEEYKCRWEGKRWMK